MTSTNISDAERREVAARLRKAIGLTEFAEVLGFDWTDDSDWVWNDVSNLVADLIESEPERTCEMVDNGRELCCSVCDWRHDYDDEPVYCSGCGAKAVSE